MNKYQRTYLLLFILMLLIIRAYPQATDFTGGNICKNEDWVLVFNDEFDGDTLNTSKWITWFPYSATGNDSCEYCRTHGDNGMIFLDSNVVVNNGTLKLVAKRQTTTWYTATRDYTSGMIHSREGFMYGRFEIRCKIPYGMGFWPAFWVFGGGHGTEIDCFEFGCQDPKHLHMGCGRWGDNGLLAATGSGYDGMDYSLDFHVFSFEWEPFFIVYKIDGAEIYRICRLITLSGEEVTWCCVHGGVYNLQPGFPKGDDDRPTIIVNLAIGTDKTPFTKAPDNSTSMPNQMEVDYIRVYQRDTAKTMDFECQVSLMPNPTSNTLTIKCKKMSKVKILNVLGELLFAMPVSGDMTQVDVGTLPKGVYIVQVDSDNGMLATKFIKF